MFATHEMLQGRRHVAATMRLLLLTSTALGAMLVLGRPVCEARGEDLAAGFRDPPRSARPWVYWMWLDGNISREGITADLEAMRRVGIEGALVMNLGAPVVHGPVRFMTPTWRAMIHHALAEAARLDMQIDINNDDGWNCGGTWIKPAAAMQQLTWSETRVKGPTTLFAGKLAQPPTTLGTYHDVAVLAFPAIAALPPAKKTVSGPPGQAVTLTYERPVTARAITVACPPTMGVARPQQCELEVSDDGKTFHSVRRFQTGWLSDLATFPTVTVGLDAVRGQFFRLTLPGFGARKAPVDFRLAAETRLDYWRLKAPIDQIREHGGGSPLLAMPGEFPRCAPGDCPDFRGQQPGMAQGRPGAARENGTVPFSGAISGAFVPVEQVHDLSRLVASSRDIAWEVPPGDWTILRIGYTPTGARNGYATAEGTGLDCDKLSRKALEAHLAGMIDKLIADAGPLRGKTWTMLHNDSWESGPQNWTADFAEEFAKRRGYDLRRWLPVLAGGRVVGSVEQSARVLWDVRRTIADLFIERHFKPFRELSHARGLTLSMESAGRQQFLYDPVAYLTAADIPMGEFWASERRPRPDCKAAASAAHLAGLPVVGGEAFTQSPGGRWQDTPYSLKTLGDRAFCFGINRFVLHRMVLEPWPQRRPGLAWPQIGVNFDSTNTWWDCGRAWIEYLTRCQYLLQQGRFVADAAVLFGEGAPNSVIRLQEEAVDPRGTPDASTMTEALLRRCGQMPALPPPGYDYDGIDVPSVLAMTVQDERLVLPSGMSYRLLVLPTTERITLALARKVRQLVQAGATVVAPKPVGSPSLSDYPKGDVEIRAIADEVWGDCDGRRATTHTCGRGRVFWGKDMRAVMLELGLRPDFLGVPVASSPAAGARGHATRLDFIHRRTNQADIYFVSNQQPFVEWVQCAFRTSGRQPEIWLPDTGRIFDCRAFQQHDGWTSVPLRLDPCGSLFVVFRRPIGPGISGTVAGNFPALGRLLAIDGPWSLHFDPRWGGPANTRFEKLQSWSRHENPGIRFYSGTATYEKTFTLDAAAIEKHKPLHLDLGAVKELAAVRLNGRDLGVLWKPPFRVDITAAVRPGENRLEVRVTNLWPNRLIGDAALPAKDRLTRVNWNPYSPRSPLLDSGLLGPVTVQGEE